MPSDKETKEEFRKRLKHEYEKFFPVHKLKELGFSRQQCTVCKREFWAQEMREVCGEPACEGGYSFIGKKRDDWDFIEVWKRFEKLFKDQGYTSIRRYPSVARWNPTMDFTIASVAAFQPYVVSGEVKAPAEKVIIPQTCIRFNDIDNVGVTGRHNTGFTMIGQLAFQEKERFNQAELFEDYYHWYTKGMKLKPKEFVIHEDAWAGGGNLGPCLEFFSGGLEIGNQVYMMYETTPQGLRDLKLRVLDMGMGQGRPSWLMSGSPTSFQVEFPPVTRHLFKSIGLKSDEQMMKAFIPYSGILNVDEDDIDESWNFISKKTGYEVSELKEGVLPLAAAYAIGDHTRTLLYTIADGALPGNVGGGYNLRVLYRRMLSFLERYGWDVDLDTLVELHAKYLKPQYPELSGQVELVKKIFAVEKRKAAANKLKNTQLITQLFDKKAFEKSTGDISKKLLELYDSQGITPEEIEKEAHQRGVALKVPENFYAELSRLHELAEEKAKHATKTKHAQSLPLEGIPETTLLYFDHWDLVDFSATVLKVIGNKVVLDQTAFYPTSGGQVHDLGTMDGVQVIEIFKQGNIAVHILEDAPHFVTGAKVSCHIDLDRRMQLAQHHTGAHILNGAAKAILGKHVWQAGAAKTPEKARLDITHYDALSDEEVKKIEDLANEVIRENRPVLKSFMERNIAESTYGFTLYQGGAVPGKMLRIVNIKDFDVEACGGTHLDVTGDVSKIKIIRTTKIQDGVIRIEFVAGTAARDYEQTKTDALEELAKELSCSFDEVPGRALELFTKWKEAGKLKKKQAPLPAELFVLSSSASFEGDVLEETAKVLKTQKEHLLKTVVRFKSELSKMR